MQRGMHSKRMSGIQPESRLMAKAMNIPTKREMVRILISLSFWALSRDSTRSSSMTRKRSDTEAKDSMPRKRKELVSR